MAIAPVSMIAQRQPSGPPKMSAIAGERHGRGGGAEITESRINY